VFACSAGTCGAIAQRGLRDTKPAAPASRPVDLVDDAVDVVVERGALLADLIVNASSSSADRHTFQIGLA